MLPSTRNCPVRERSTAARRNELGSTKASCCAMKGLWSYFVKPRPASCQRAPIPWLLPLATSSVRVLVHTHPPGRLCLSPWLPSTQTPELRRAPPSPLRAALVHLLPLSPGLSPCLPLRQTLAVDSSGHSLSYQLSVTLATLCPCWLSSSSALFLCFFSAGEGGQGLE